MERAVVQQIRDALEALSLLAGVPVLWRPLRSATVLAHLAERQYHHCNLFCLAVKGDPARHAVCCRAESTELAADCERHRAPWLKDCHAGTTELVVPLLEDGRYAGALVAGPFRRPGQRCPVPGLARTFASLPVFDAKRCDVIRDALVLAAGHILAMDRELPLSGTQPGRDPRTERALAFLERHHARPVSLTEVAAHIGLSPWRLARRFRAETGRTVVEHLTVLRIDAAQRLLATTDRPIADIALATGFPDQSWFGAVFRRRTGMTPRAFRLHGREGGAA